MIDFFDTNIVVYYFDDATPVKRDRARRLLADDPHPREIVISTQVLQEFYSTVSTKFRNRFEPDGAERAVRSLTRYRVIQVDVPIILAATTRVQTASISFWDALIVESALAAGATRLLTEDLQHGQVFDGTLRVENPFR